MPVPSNIRTPAATWAGRVLSAAVAAILLVDAGVNLLAPELLRTEIEASGFTVETADRTGWVLLVCTLLYALPRTAVLGAILVTGFLGGAICAHFRLGEIGTMPQLLSLALGAMAWGGLYLRDARLRDLLPLVSAADRSRGRDAAPAPAASDAGGKLSQA